ncbi:hypothetical protein CFAM422_004843 [Trichoderma lentiforme]|uniref:Uncharacterized protein n=1 Tax=Trichoderma lentiforme TaxID=1567552 RepID=A0A9P4XI14_9HYPO|nr:hypothetical protein CFAM422_004843 [Trichoderma lentiforme]
METSEFNALSAWYVSPEGPECTASAEGIFKEALAEFSEEFTKDGKQQQWITDSKYGNFEGVLASVEEARVYYEERKGNSKLQLITAVSDMKLSIVTEQGITASARIEFRQRLSEVQLMQLLSQLSVTVLPDPIKAFQLLLFVSKKRQSKSSIKGEAFWLDSRIQKWNKDKDSSLVIINGTWKTRFHLQSFCAKSIAILFDAKCPVIWALKALNIDKTGADQAQVSTIDLLKYIISQAVSVNKSIHTDAALVPRLMAHIDAKAEEDWMNILASVLQGIPLLYIMIDVEVLGENLGTLTKDFWPTAFLRMFSELSARNIGTVVKVVLISYGSPLLKGPLRKEYQDLVISVGGVRQTRASVARARKQGSSISRTRRNVRLEAMYNR